MPITYTKHTLEKLESVLKDQQYKVRYEKGNFKTAACVLDQNKVIVINRFSTLESKINELSQLLLQIPLDENALNDKQKQFLYTLKQFTLQL
ncbi:hypothetical protein ADIARSV_1884 [Arcticibacter svalbardensis MN12-7]|uniref:Uncharacterized protein n=1 Tax=Arcticibacter svalbardensis MN12-7 TaxID=1150600 RepID=R9GTA2_9SPHI|nr:hypothetical protein [Arcticibacter svalbardensis]EOR94923.1 hypothetical protein ADIARSV_1884 [Arcticibacter svalbardensis MN12-7]